MREQRKKNSGKRALVTVISVISVLMAVAGYVLLLITWNIVGRPIDTVTKITRLAEMLIPVVWLAFVLFFSKKEKYRFFIPVIFGINIFINVLFIYTNILNINQYRLFGLNVSSNVYLNLFIQIAIILALSLSFIDFFGGYKSKKFTLIAVLCICAERAYYIATDIFNIIKNFEQYTFNISTLNFYLRTLATVLTYIAVVIYVFKCKKYISPVAEYVKENITGFDF